MKKSATPNIMNISRQIQKRLRTDPIMGQAARMFSGV